MNKLKLGGTPINDNIAGEIALLDEKVAVNANDVVIIEDSENGLEKKKAKLGSLSSNLTQVQENDTLSGTVNDYALVDISTAAVARFDVSGANVNLTGIVPPNPITSKELVIVNADDTKSIGLKHNDAGSNAINRFLCPNNQEYLLKRNSGVRIQYDVVSMRWRIAGVA